METKFGKFGTFSVARSSLNVADDLVQPGKYDLSSMRSSLSSIDPLLADVTKAGRHELLFRLSNSQCEYDSYIKGGTRYSFPSNNRNLNVMPGDMMLFGVPIPSLNVIGRSAVLDDSSDIVLRCKLGMEILSICSSDTKLCELPYNKWTWGNSHLEANRNRIKPALAPYYMNLDDAMDYSVDRSSISNAQYGMGLLKYNGSCDGNNMTILVDGGASGTPTSFNNSNKISSCYGSLETFTNSGHKIELLPEAQWLKVTVANGHDLDCKYVCKNVTLRIGKYTEVSHVYLLPIKGQFDVVLGKPWHNLREPQFVYATNEMTIDKTFYFKDGTQSTKKYVLGPDESTNALPIPYEFGAMFSMGHRMLNATREKQLQQCGDLNLLQNDDDEEYERPLEAEVFHKLCKSIPSMKTAGKFPCLMAVVRALGENIDLPMDIDLPERVAQFDPASYEYAAQTDLGLRGPDLRRQPANRLEQYVFDTYKDSFFPETLPKGMPQVKLSPLIRLKDGEDAAPCKPAYKLTKEHAIELRKQIDYYLAQGWIRPSDSPYGAPILFIPKANGKLRMCIDYRALNKLTVKDKYPLPDIEQIMDLLSGATHFSKIDLAQGYHQCQLDDSDVPKTAFRSILGAYEWLVLGFGLTNAVPAFVRIINNVLKDYIGISAICFIDDILIYSKGDEFDHQAAVVKIMDTLTAAGLKGNWEKCQFLASEVPYCGINVSANGLFPMEDKVKAISEWKIPETVYNIRSFLGAVGYYRKFIANFAEIASPLNELTKALPNRKKVVTTNVTLTKFGRRVRTEDIRPEWTEECLRSFNLLKKAMVSAPVLKLPDNTKPYEIFVDASQHAMGAVLMQRHSDGMHPVSFYSKKFSTAESHYAVHEQELLGLFMSLKHWRHYLIMNHVSIYTDHAPLTFLKTQPILSPRQYRWLTYFSDFDTEIIAVEGIKNVVADALSRYAFGTDFEKAIDKIRIKFLETVLTKPAEVDYIYKMQGFAFLSIGNALSYQSATMQSVSNTRSLFYGDEVVTTTESQRLLNFEKILRDSYVNDSIAQSVIKGTSVSYNYTLNKENIIIYNDRGGNERIYIPKNASCTPRNVSTKFPIKGEKVREYSTLREELIADVHEDGHPGKGKTAELMTRYYYWPGMISNIQSFIRGCVKCQTNKGKHHAPYGLSQPLAVPSCRWSEVSMDFIMDLPRTSSGYNAIFVVVDRFSKRAHFIPYKTTYGAMQTAEIFFREIYKLHGLPSRIISDRDSRFRSDFWQHLMSKFGTRLAMSTSFSPQSDGQTERTNRTLEDMLRCYTDNNHRTWDQFLCAAEFSYNNTLHTAHGYTPFFLDLGYNPMVAHSQVFADLVYGKKTLLPDSPYLPNVNYDDAAHQFYEDWNENIVFAKCRLNEAAEHMQQNMDARRTPMVFKVRQWVWLDTKHISLPNASGKLTDRTTFDKRRMGPYEILEVLSNGRAYKLDLMGSRAFHNVQPIRRLEPVLSSTVFPEAHEIKPPLPVPTEDADDPEYEIEKIVQMKVQKGRKLYKVRYLGYSEKHDQWKSLSQLRNCMEFVHEYNSRDDRIILALQSCRQYCASTMM